MEFKFAISKKVGGVIGAVLALILIPLVLIEYVVLRGDVVVREYETETLEPLSYDLNAPDPVTTYLVELECEDRLQFALDAQSMDGTSLFEWRETRRSSGTRYVSFSPGVEGPFTLTVSRTGDFALVDVGPAWVRVYEDDRRIGPKLHFKF